MIELPWAFRLVRKQVLGRILGGFAKQNNNKTISLVFAVSLLMCIVST